MLRPLLLLCLALLAIVSAVPAVPVTAPTVITVPGTYELGADIAGAGENAGIEIRASDVVIEGNGHLIAGGDRSMPGILVQGNDTMPADRVRIRNLTVRSWQYGVRAIGATALVLDSVTAEGNAEHGIYLFSTSNSTVRNCTAAGNRGSGVVLSDVSQDNAVEGTTARQNDHNGLMLIASMRNRLTGNTIRGNGAYGIDTYLARENAIADNLFVNANNTRVEELDRNTWSLPASAGPNIAGGPQRGGNFWGTPDGRGFSEVTPDANGDGFCDSPYVISTGNVDQLPLRAAGGVPSPTRAPGPGALAVLAALAALALVRRRV